MSRRALIVVGLILLAAIGSVARALAAGQALTGVKAVAGGGGHGLAVKTDGTLVAWGYNAYGQLGIGRAGVSVTSPTPVHNLSSVNAAAGGEFHTLALKSDGTVWGIGDNTVGELGTGTKGSTEDLPVQAVGLPRATAIAAGVDRSYAVSSTGTVWAWGANDSGQLGNGTTQGSARPIQVPALTGIVSVSAGAGQTLALTGSGTVFGWGQDRYGQVGDGNSCNPAAQLSCNRLSPVRVKGLSGPVSAIAAGQNGDYTLALMKNGTVMAWGRNDQGQLGSGTLSSNGCKCRPTPAAVSGVSGAIAIAASGGAGAALLPDGTVRVWGNNTFGQLGNGTMGGNNGTPQHVKGLAGVKTIVGGGGFFLAVTSSGAVLGWGINSFGELGIGNFQDSPHPVPVGVAQAAASPGLGISANTLLIVAVGAALLIAVLLATRRRSAPARWPAPAVQWGGKTAAVPYFVPTGGPLRAAAAREPVELDDAWREYGRRVRLLSKVDLFEAVSNDALAEVATALKSLPVAAKEIVCREGDIGDRLFLVESGTLAITADVGGKPREMARLGPGEFFGDGALLDQPDRSATVSAVTDARLWTLAALDFQRLRVRHPEIDEPFRRAAGQRDGASKSGSFDVSEISALHQDGSAIGIGRDADNQIVLASPLVSRHHAVIESAGDHFRLRDLDSRNGTFVNGARVRTTVLRNGDEVWMGDEQLFFDGHGVRRTLERRGIRLDVSNVSRELPDGRKLLNDVSVSVLPGEFVAVVGGSGAGKTTLLNAMSGLHPATSGRVLYNGRDYYRNVATFRSVLGYVPQDDIIHTDLPLRLTLRHAAKLRLAPDSSPEDLDAAVDKALAELDLTDQAGVKVGSLSGGQRKRASIGVELLSEPRIFFLDEPTSGLDPFTDAQMMRLLRRLADAGSTVILTTHATKNVMLCDKVVFLAPGGHLVFVGTPQRALRYFGTPSFDGIYEKLAEKANPEVWDKLFRASEDYGRVLGDQLQPEAPEVNGAAPVSLGESVGAGGLALQVRQFLVLSRRNFDLVRHNPKNLPSLVMPPILFTVLALALFHSGVFEHVDNSAACLQIVFLIAFSSFIFGLLFAVQEIVKEFAIFRRERMVNLGILPYVLSKLTVLAPLLTVLLVVMLVILRLTGRLPASGFGVYGQLLLTLVLTGFVGLGLALLTSALVATPQQATDMLSVWIMPQVLFGGALLSVPAMNFVGRALSAFQPVRWSFEGLGHIVDLNVLFRIDTSRIGPGLAIEYGDSFSRNPVQNWIILAVFIAVPIALTCLVLNRRTKTV